MRAASLVFAIVGLGCGSTYVVVTVDAQPSVHGAATLSVTLSNDNATATSSLQLAMHDFPVTFAVDASGRTGDLAIQVDAIDANSVLVGRGTTTAALSSSAASVTLDSADFVVNTDFAGDQELSDDLDANGLQLGAAMDQSWTVGFHGSCNPSCDMLGRRFDVNGAPLESQVAASTNQFTLTTTQADGVSTPAMTGGGMFAMAFWDFESTDGTINGVACEHLDLTGAELDTQQSIATDSLTDVVSATALADGHYAVSWNALLASQVIRGVVVDSSCTPQSGTLVTISNNGAAVSASRGHVAANGSSLLYAWLEDADVHVRSATGANTLGVDATFLSAGSADEVPQYVRVTPMAQGFGVVVRTASSTSETDPGHIFLYLTDLNGQMIGPGPILITDKAGSDFDSVESFGVATRGDGATIVVWHGCMTNGDGQGCGVFGRIVRPSGVPVGDSFVLATTTAGDQKAPSAVGLTSSFAVAWNDASATAPDVSGLAVRGRVIDPPYDDASAVLGAPCSGDAPCGDGLICTAGNDQTNRCYEQCDPTAAPPLCPDGGTCTTGGCVF